MQYLWQINHEKLRIKEITPDWTDTETVSRFPKKKLQQTIWRKKTKNKKQFEFFANIRRSHLTLHVSHFLREDTTYRQERDSSTCDFFLRMNLYICEWVGFHIYTGCCQRGSFLLTNPEYWNMGYITRGQVYA